MRLRREARRTRFLINNARLNLIDYDKSKDTDNPTKPSEIMKPETKIEQKTFDTVSIFLYFQYFDLITSQYSAIRGNCSLVGKSEQF